MPSSDDFRVVGLTFLCMLIVVGVLVPTVFIRPYTIYAIALQPLATRAPTAANSSASYNIDVSYQNVYSISVTSAMDAAINAWRRVLPETLDSYLVVEANQVVCSHVFSQQTVIYDLLIHVTIATIDGVGGVIGYAGPCYVDSNYIPRFGVIFLDIADISDLIVNGMLKDVFEHEIGHILGIGTLWIDGETFNGTTQSAPYSGYPYLLPYANIEDDILGHSGGASVENTGGSGTAGNHWKETIYDHEIMTGYVESGGNMPLSRLTVAALKDLGYVVDLEAADAYILPSGQRRRLRSSTAHRRKYVGCNGNLPPPIVMKEQMTLNA